MGNLKSEALITTQHLYQLLPMTSFNDYMEVRQAKLKRKQRTAALISAACFMGSTVFAIANFIVKDLQQLSQPVETPQESINSHLELQENGYNLVLQREPQNQTALDGLVQVRLQMKDFQGAQKPLQQLIKLNPTRQDYQALLEQVKHKASDRK
uniref:tetratricopeptide repeat protein n=1 Tax=Trichocoleus desertorum TaxID=1481672 RepID=UPI0025B372A0|nr:tetratricopeptide repeat protein [Trichocoleus desertorum]